jgi:hypothetical protein
MEKVFLVPLKEKKSNTSLLFKAGITEVKKNKDGKWEKVNSETKDYT